MGAFGRGSLLLAVLLVAALAWATPDGKDAARYDEAGVAPVYAWTVAGGNSAASGEASTPLPRGPLEVAWKSELPGKIEGEPLVWDERIVVAVHRGGDKRELHMLNRADGKAIGAPVRWQSLNPPEPALWGAFCLAVTKPGGVSAYRLGRERLERKWHQQVPLVERIVPVGRDVYVMAAGTVQCWRVGESKARWTCRPSGSPSGLPVIRGDTIYFLTYDAEGNAHVSTGDRRTGEPSYAPVYVGNHGNSGVPSQPAQLVALEGALVVRFGAGDAHARGARRQRRGVRPTALVGPRLHDAPTRSAGGGRARLPGERGRRRRSRATGALRRRFRQSLGRDVSSPIGGVQI